MGIARLKRLGQCVAKAGVVCLACPEKCGELLIGMKGVSLEILGHKCPVNTANIFSPAKNLPDKSFNGCKWRLAFSVYGFGCVYDFSGI